MFILITHAFSLEQKGDSALLAGTISQMRKAFPGARIEAQIMGHTTASQEYKNAPVMESVIYIATVPDINKLFRLFRMGYVLAITLLWAWIVRFTGRSFRLGMSPVMYRSCQAIYLADLVVPVAGGYLAGAPGFGETLNMVFIVLPLWLAHIIRKPVVHFSQSIGPFSNRLQRWLVQGPLRRARLVITRESVSTDFALGLGVDPGRLEQSIDAGFLFEPEKNFRMLDVLDGPERRDVEKSLVGITSKKHLGPTEQIRYEQELAAFADYVCSKLGMQVVYIPQVTSSELAQDDRVLNRRLYELMACKSNAFLIEKNLTNHETKALIDQLDFMVGTRFHSVIFALTGYVPAIGLEYEHKTSGILRDLGLEHWMIKMADLRAPELEKLFDQLVAGRQEYLAHLRRVMPDYLERVDKVRGRLRTVLVD